MYKKKRKNAFSYSVFCMRDLDIFPLASNTLEARDTSPRNQKFWRKLRSKFVN